MKIASRPGALYDRRDNCFIFDHFQYYVSGDLWTNLAADAGVTAFAETDAIGGRISGATGATDNNEIAIATSNELFLMGAGEPLWCSGHLQFTEANTDDANVMFGFMSALAANSLVDDGAGVRTSGNYAVIYKVDGGTVWRCSSRNGSDVSDNVSLTTAGGTAFQELEIEIVEYSTTECEIVYKVDNVPLRDTNTNDVISHRLPYASATEMNFGAYLKAGGANSETLVIDWLAAGQRLH